MRAARRTVQILVIAWGTAGIANGITWVISGDSEGWLAVAGLTIGALAGWLTTRNLDPWTTQDLRDGAIGWGIVGTLIVLGVTLAFTPEAARIPVGIAVSAVCLTAAAVTYGNADRLGAPDPERAAEEPAATPQQPPAPNAGADAPPLP